MLNVCEIVFVKTSRKVHSNRPPSSRSVSQQKLHRLSNASVSTRPPSVFNKNPLLPPIGASAPAATSLSPGSDSSASVPLDLSATPAAETWSRAQCSSKGASVSSLANSATVTPNNDESCATAVACSHRQSTPTEATVIEAGSKQEDRHMSAAASHQQRAECSCLRADDALEGEPSSRTSGLTVKLSKSQLRSKATDGTDAAVTHFKPDCSCSSQNVTSENIVDLPLISPGSARLTVTDAACQCDELSSDVKSGESETCANDDNSKHMLASAAGRDDVGSSVAHPLSDTTKTVDWWSKELVSATSILGFSPSPTRRLRSGASSRTAQKFHGLNAHEMQTVSNVLNSLARSQSRAAGSAAARTPAPVAAVAAAEPRVPTTERLRLTVSNNDELEARTHNSAETHAGSVSVTPFDPKINGFSGPIVEHFCVTFGYLSCIVFLVIVQKSRQTHRQRT